MSRKMIKSLGSTKPNRMWIDGKCFNIKPFKKPSKTKSNETIIQSTEDINKTEASVVEVEIKNEIDVTTDDNGKLCISFQLPSIYYIKLSKFNDFDVNALSQKTQTVITFPKHGDGKLIIKGEDKTNVQEALENIHSVVGAIRNQSMALQFISIPLLSDEIKNNFEKFKAYHSLFQSVCCYAIMAWGHSCHADRIFTIQRGAVRIIASLAYRQDKEILSEKDIKGMHESIFQSSLKLHLTVNVFALTDEREKKEAINTLEEYKTIVLGPLLEKIGPLKIQVTGIDCMNSDYKNVDVLYANAKLVDETEDANLQKIVNGISDYFYERGLVRGYQENVKLHMTLINTKYRKVSDSPNRKRWNKRQSFDATSIMEKYKEFDFGVCNLDSIHLSLISSTGEDGFYKPLSIIKM